MKTIGLDAGSVSVKVVVLDESGAKTRGVYVKHMGHPLPVALDALRGLGADILNNASIAVTGSSGRLIADAMAVDAVNEIVAQAYATQKLYPHIKSIIEMGGEDSKLILMSDSGVADFSINSVCAAGTGSFLDQQSERLKLGIEEFSRMALKSPKPPRIAGRCSVFAKSDMIHLQQIATPVEDIVAGLCFAVARNFKGSIARGRHINAPVIFQGGVAANAGMVRAFKEVLSLDELFVPPDFALMGAMGAALKAFDEGLKNTADLSKLESFINSTKGAGRGHPPLRTANDAFYDRHVKDSRDVLHVLPPDSGKIKAYMGVDIGSISTNVAVIDENGNLLSKRYLMTAGRPIEAVRQGLRETFDEIGNRIEVMGVGTTGSGRYMIADYIGADIVKNEITAQATAAAYIDPDVDTIFEIGGQDSKFIALRDGVIIDFEMNKACAAGTGSFLEEQAEKLNISVKGEFAECAFTSECPSRLGERCTVFMENSLMANLQKGAEKNDLFAGLAYSIVQNYINRVVAGRPIGKKIFFQGGVAFNKSVVAAFEKFVGSNVIVPQNHDVTGAIGMALIAMRRMIASGESRSAFKGFARSSVPYEISSFGCNSCSNMCEINRVKIEGEKGHLFYGGRCEKYDINKKIKHDIPDLFKFRDEALWRAAREIAENPGKGGRGRIGIPYVFYFNEYLPYWATLLNELGFDVEISPRPNRQVIDLGLESVISEACYPVKVALGHVRYLRDKGVDAIMLPSFVNLNNESDEFPNGLACPHTQTMPYVSRVALEGLKVMAPVVDMSLGDNYLAKELKSKLKGFGVRKREIAKAMDAAANAQKTFNETVRQKGAEVLSSLAGRAVVIVGRSYNALERGMNLQIPEKLATLGIMAIPMDMLPLDRVSLTADWPNMYWRSGQKILRAARIIADNDKLFPIYIGNFSCGPDSFILKYFKDELKSKPFLHIEIDEHSADAGAITRCEAFLDSIGNQRASDKPAFNVKAKAKRVAGFKEKTVYIPRMADHAYAIAAAFERSGVKSEVLPEPDKESVDIGMRFVSGKECYPCVVTTGDMVKCTTMPDFDPDGAAFFMPSGSGPCRFGQYNVFHRTVLDTIGLHNVPVFAPNQDEDFYRHLGMVDGNFALNSWKGVIAVEILQKCLRETRPYERDKGSSDALYDKYISRLYASLRGVDGKLEGVLKDMRREFESLPCDKTHKKPLVGVVGEIYVRSNRFSNEDLVRKIEALGGEVWLAPVEEWIYYINMMGIRKSLINKQGSVMLNTLIKRFFKTRVERKYSRHFEGFLKTLHEPSTLKIMDLASPYVHSSFEGETILSMGKAVDLAAKGADGIVNAMPFGCMPGTIVSALMRALSRDHGIPVISMAYDGTESSSTGLQLEAFMDQAWNMMRQRR